MTGTPRGHDRVGPAEPVRPDVEIRRSARRRRTVSARLEGDTFVVLMPAGLSREEEQRHVDNLMARHLRAQSRRRLEGEGDLMARAVRLSERYLDGRARPASISWVTNQQRRWGSCSTASRTIRLSTELEGMPSWVVDSVIVHELAHLLEPNHGHRFQALVGRYDRYAESTAFLHGVAFARGLEMREDDGDLERD